MSRIARYGWLAIVIIILVLFVFLALRFVPGFISGKSANPSVPGTSTQVSRSPSPNGTSPSPSSTPPVNRTPTQSTTPSGAGTQLLQLSNDPYTNGDSQHRTEVEPDTYSYGSTIVSAFQAGRFTSVGSSNIGWATSTDGGITWQHGFLPGTTKLAGGPYDRITDPSVAYDAAHSTWMIATTVFQYISTGITAPAVLVSLSTDDGLSWSQPVTVADVGSRGHLDKDWIVCDDTSTSQYYGHCYIEWDDIARNNLIQMSTSTDGGRTWGVAKTTADHASGISGYPLVQPGGTVIVPISNADQTAIMVFTSNDGGASWSRTVTITSVTSFSQSAYFRDYILLTAGIDGSGRVYLVWVDCRFEANCHGNDLVMTTSVNGVVWTPVRRIPIAPVGSGVDYYVSGLGVDGSTSGLTTHLALTFYYYSANCANDCTLSVGFVSSVNGGYSWSAKARLAGPFPASWVAAGNNKVGDYISVSFSNGRAFPVFAVATAPGGGHLNEAMYTMQGGLEVVG